VVEYLFVGGPEHGHRIRVEPWCQTYRVPLPMEVRLTEAPVKPTGSFTVEDVDRYLDQLPKPLGVVCTTYEYRRYAFGKRDAVGVYVWSELSTVQALDLVRQLVKV
jgi:hypothetical protein